MYRDAVIWFPQSAEFDPVTGAASPSCTPYVVQSVSETRFRIAGNVQVQRPDVMLIVADAALACRLADVRAVRRRLDAAEGPLRIRVFAVPGQTGPLTRTLSLPGPAAAERSRAGLHGRLESGDRAWSGNERSDGRRAGARLRPGGRLRRGSAHDAGQLADPGPSAAGGAAQAARATAACSRCPPVEVRARRDDLVDPVEQLSVELTSTAPSWLSSCSIVRGPMIAAVTAGCRSTNASAISISVIPASSASARAHRRPRACAGSRAATGRSAPGSGRPGARRRLLALAVAAAQPAARERAPRDHAHAVPLQTGSTSARSRGRAASRAAARTTKRSRPRRSAVHCASTISWAGKVELPM